MVEARDRTTLQRRTAVQFPKDNSYMQIGPVIVDHPMDANDSKYDEQKGHHSLKEKIIRPPFRKRIFALALSKVKVKLRQAMTTTTLLDKDDEMLFCAVALLFAMVVYLCCLFSYQSISLPHRALRATTVNDEDLLDPLHLRIPCLNFGDYGFDIGGWLFFRKFDIPIGPIENRRPDRGDITFIGPFGKERSIRPDDEAAAKEYWESTHNYSHKVPYWLEPNEAIEDQPLLCRRPNWMNLYNPSCNAVHELDLSLSYSEETAGLGDDQVIDSMYMAHGFYRDVWMVIQPDQDQRSVLKATRWKHEYDLESFYYDFRDALVMERLTASPRIVDIYGHCGTAVWVEAIPYEVEEVIVPGNGYAKQRDLHDEVDVKPRNDFTAEEKLDMAISMAESLADLHGFKDGVIVHDDVQLCQWLRTEDGRLKLGDFNRAEIMEFNVRNGQYCKYDNGGGLGNYRSPEEYIPDPLDEKIDVWSFGNNIYALLTGLWIFYENEEDDEVVQEKLIQRQVAYIDPRYRTRSFIEGKLVDIMEKCWVYEPEERIDMFKVIRLLRQVKQDYVNIRGEEFEH